MSVPEKWRALAHAWVDGAEIEATTTSGFWVRIGNPGFVESCEYRIKPKAKVKKWRWVANTIGTSHFFVTPNHYANSENAFKNAHIFQLVQKIDSTMIEVDEETGLTTSQLARNFVQAHREESYFQINGDGDDAN